MELVHVKQEVKDECVETNDGREIQPFDRHRTIFQPIVIGNTARLFAKPNCEGHTHEWILYVKPYFKGVDMAKFIRKVIFVLEPHYRSVTLTKPPFVVKRTGWGEFTVQIKVYMTFSSRAQTLSHWLRLVEYADKNDETSEYRYVPSVRYEEYDEIVIEDPTEAQRRAMLTGTTEPDPEFEHFKLEREQALWKIRAARERIRADIEGFEKRLEASRAV
ncbi:YEATS domain-containing protein 4 [Galendromus occidentalis]|uniref:YEATS domain-containing protein 4 n=1 Tax=Galendromus occidentalis TaxID=34638 RepID=A0AAJ6VZP9_9ACAR|nr:YEATS domain-containing protein 4 [Galendromus occidentalis]